VITGAALASTTSVSAATNLVANPGFETGTLSPWTCDAGTSTVVTSPVHSGSHALAATPTSNLTAQCSQTVSVQPNTSYTLSAWVLGNYAYIGDTGTGTTDTSNWISTSTWAQLSTTFTTGASTTSVKIWVHGWYNQGTVYSDDFLLTGGSTPPPTTTTTALPPTTTTTKTTTTTTATTTSGTPSGSGAPPASFWGDTSTIPAAKNVLEVKILNRTNGQYPDSQVYWSFSGQTNSIAQQPYIDMPANSAGRMYFYLGAPNSQYYDFIEFTVGPSSINVDTTRVDRFGLKTALLLHSHAGTDQQVGENYATFLESRSATFQRFGNSVPTEFKSLATDQAPYGIPSPGNDHVFQAGGQYANYYSSYAASVGDTSDSTAQIFGCGGTLANNPQLCAGLNRHVAQLPTSSQSDPSQFYKAAPANYYAQFWHQNAINGMQYGFPYDDYASQSSDISVSNPQYMIVAIGW
jgi:hypothetical protein